MISNNEFKNLISLEKEFETNDLINTNGKWERVLKESRGTEAFLLNFSRSSFELRKFTINNRYKTSIVLFRYDSSGRHGNPDGTIFNGPHIHIYDENYGDKIAYEVDDVFEKIIVDKNDTCEVFKAFFNYFNIKNPPLFNSGMFDTI